MPVPTRKHERYVFKEQEARGGVVRGMEGVTFVRMLAVVQITSWTIRIMLRISYINREARK